MNWKQRLMAQASEKLRDVAESETAKNFSARAKQTATTLAKRAQEGAIDAAQSFIEANSDPNALKLQFLNARLSVLAPSQGFEMAHPSAGTIVVSDGENNGLIINAGAKPAYVVDTIGNVTRLNQNTYDLGPEDGINVVVLDT